MNVDLKEIKLSVCGDLWLNNNTYKDVAELCDTYGPLFAGTENERKGKDWLLAKFREYGLEHVRAEEFRYMGWRRGDLCKLELIGARSFCGRPMRVFALPRSPPTPDEGVEGEMIYLGSGTREDFERNEEKIPGRMVMAQSGGPVGSSIYRITKYHLAREMGAEGFIFMFGMEGELIPAGTAIWGPRYIPGRGFLPEDDYVEKPPAMGVSWETGHYLLRLMRKRPVRVRMTTNNEYIPNTPGWNIIGDVSGCKYPDEMVLIGAHWDGHDIGQGALDNALGAVGLLNIGRALAKHKGKFKRTLRVVSFGVEETHMAGSRSYAERHKDEIDNIVCMFNCDGFARRGDAIITSNNDEVLRYLRNTVREEDIPINISSQFKGRSGSDATPFYLEGVPTAIFSGTTEPGERASGRYPDHTAADTVDKLNVKRIRTATMKFAQILISMLSEEKRLAYPVPSEEILRELDDTARAVDACRGRCVGYRLPFE